MTSPSKAIIPSHWINRGDEIVVSVTAKNGGSRSSKISNHCLRPMETAMMDESYPNSSSTENKYWHRRPAARFLLASTLPARDHSSNWLA